MDASSSSRRMILYSLHAKGLNVWNRDALETYIVLVGLIPNDAETAGRPVGPVSLVADPGPMMIVINATEIREPPVAMTVKADSMRCTRNCMLDLLSGHRRLKVLRDVLGMDFRHMHGLDLLVTCLRQSLRRMSVSAWRRKSGPLLGQGTYRLRGT